jgi:hypothetical protein
VLRETTSRGLCGLVCPSRTSDARSLVRVCFITAGPVCVCGPITKCVRTDVHILDTVTLEKGRDQKNGSMCFDRQRRAWA